MGVGAFSLSGEEAVMDGESAVVVSCSCDCRSAGHGNRTCTSPANIECSGQHCVPCSVAARLKSLQAGRDKAAAA